MKNQITTYLDNTITVLLLLVAGITPLLFLNQTTEFYEIPKLVFLVVSTVILLGAWIFSWIIKGKVVINRTPLDIPLVILLIAIVVSTYFSTSRLSSLYGDFPNINDSSVAWVTYILLYFVTVSHLRNIVQIRSFLYVLYGSAVIIAVITVLSFFHVFLPFDFAKGVNFTPTGSSFSTIAFLLLLLPFPLLSLSNPNKYFPAPAALVLSILFGVTIVLIGSIPSYIALLIAILLCVFVARPNAQMKTLPLFLLPIVAMVLTLILAYLPFPGNPLQQLEANFPKEIQLPLPISWKISASAFRDAPFIGTGPSTYLFNFTTYKPVEFNVLNYWNFSFDTANNEFLQALATLGIFGLAALFLVCLVILINSWRKLSLHTTDAEHDNPHVLLAALAVSALVSIVLLAIHTTTLVSVVMTFFIFAALMMSQRNIREKVMEFSMGIKASTSGNKQFDLFPIIIFIVFLVAAVPVLYRTFNMVAADYYHRQALSRANSSGTLTYQYLQKAETLNPQVDLYRVDMAQTNFALANAIVAKAVASNKQASPAAALSSQDKQTVQTLLAQAVNEGRAATVLNPRSSRNWEVLASIYRNIAGVAQNALTFSLDAYGRAIQLDPLNPALRVNVGGIYYSVKNYPLATRFFTDAANLKPDYANAYYNLAIALRDSGDYQNAVLVTQQTVALLSKVPGGPDYKTATKLLADLKSKAASQTNQTSQAAPSAGLSAPGAQTNSSLNSSNVSNVKVSNLNNPPSVTPVPTIKANPNANIPQSRTR